MLVDEVTALTRKSEQNSFNRSRQALFIIEGLGAPVKNNIVLFKFSVDFKHFLLKGCENLLDKHFYCKFYLSHTVSKLVITPVLTQNSEE